MGPHEPITVIGAGHPERSLPNVADTMARMSVRNHPVVTVLARRLAFEQRHPEVTICPSGQTRSGLWEADWAGRAESELAGYDTCAELLDYLEARFDGHDEDLAAERAEDPCMTKGMWRF